MHLLFLRRRLLLINLSRGLKIVLALVGRKKGKERKADGGIKQGRSRMKMKNIPRRVRFTK